jgi:hypothetical protein
MDMNLLTKTELLELIDYYKKQKSDLELILLFNQIENRNKLQTSNGQFLDEKTLLDKKYKEKEATLVKSFTNEIARLKKEIEKIKNPKTNNRRKNDSGSAGKQ